MTLLVLARGLNVFVAKGLESQIRYTIRVV